MPLRPPSDDDLILAVRDGDESACAELFRRYRDHLYRVASRYTRDPGAIEDAVEEAFIRFFRAVEGYDPSYGRLGAYLARIVGNICIDRLKEIRRRRDWLDDLRQALAARVDAPPDPELVEQVMKAIPSSCDKLGREVFDLHVEGLPYSEIAARLGLKEKTVSGYICVIRQRILSRLRNLIRP
jgi:RNA polymerase sigma-70 factor (ECF subfamily)